MIPQACVVNGYCVHCGAQRSGMTNYGKTQSSIVVNIISSNSNHGGHDIGDWVTCSSTIQFNYITITY